MLDNTAKKINRLLSVIVLLQSNKDISINDLKSKFNVSERTIFRDLSLLTEIGIPITFTKDKGYSILNTFYLPPMNFTNDELKSILFVASLTNNFGNEKIEKDFNSVVAKIMNLLNQRKNDEVNNLVDKIKVYPYENKNNKYISLIQDSIINKKIIKISYKNNMNIRSEREVEPIGLTFYSNQWHLIAWCWLRKDYRDFKLNSIIFLETTDVHFLKNNHKDLNEYIIKLQKDKTTDT